MEKHNKIMQFLLNIYISLFIFTTLNKEFLLFGIDLRFIMLPLGFLLVCIKIIYSKNLNILCYIKKSSIDKYLILFYLYAFISNISWIWNGLDINELKFVNEIILLINIFVAALVIILYKNMITQSYVSKNIIISGLVLVLSMGLVSCGFDANQISMSTDEPYMYKTRSWS